MANYTNDMDRRQFLQISTGSAAAMLLAGIQLQAEETKTQRPNILWVSCEDISPDLGCYGDSYAVTPNIDKLAAEGVRYTNAYTHAGVCAPVRSGIITGMYPTTIGTQYMRCKGVPPTAVKCFTEYLRAAGYYCSNNSKTDYQFDPPMTAWDQSSRKAHWRNRPEGQPFFSVMNLTISHESQNWPKKGEKLTHNPAEAIIPPYYPDTPVVRENLARYYDNVTKMDEQAGEILRQLQEDGLADSTIVWFWSDHGRGLPRCKRWIYDSGIRVPLVIRVPEKLRSIAMPKKPEAVKPGTINDEMVAFIDFAPTMLSLAGVKIPAHIQGQAFLGGQKTKPREYIFAARDRMDETYDLIRAVRDKRFKYIRNYMPYLTRGQDIEYMNRMPIMQEMRRLNAAGKLKGPQRQYFEETKPVEELYDTQKDPHEVNNLAGDPNYKDVLERMRKVHNKWVEETGDIGLIPEPVFDEMKRPGGVWRKTADPEIIVLSSRQDTVKIKLTCATPGASIAYKFRKAPDKDSGWRLYNETLSIVLAAGRTELVAKACRIGFKDSNEVRFKLGDPVVVVPPSQIVLHWREKLNKTDLLKRLRKIKDLDRSGNKAIPKYYEALKDKYASVRYWAVVGLHNNCKTREDIRQAKAALKKMLKDDSVVVRVAAAHALCDWGQEKEGLPVLVEALKYKNNKAGLYTVTTLMSIGEKARPALPQIRDCLKDSDGYVKRVTQAVLKRLEDH